MTPKIFPIPGHPDYGLSKDARVWRIKPYEHKCQRPIPFEMATHLACGYRKVNLTIATWKILKVSVARMMLLTFVGKPPTPKHQAAHNNGKRNDDRIENLRWATRVENAADCILHGTDGNGDRNHNCKLSASQVVKIRKLLGKKELSQSEIARRFGVSQTTIWAIGAGRIRRLR